MKALITGIAGFAGSHLAEYLLAHTGLEVSGIIHKRDENIAHLRDRLTLFRGDLRDADSVHGILAQASPDYIFHLAAQAFVPLSWRDPWGTLENNIRITLNILEAVVALGIKPRILIVGSADEYGLVSENELPISEDAPLRPYSPYAVSKIAQDMLGYQYHVSYKLPIVRVRPFNHIGPRQSEAFVAADFAKQIAEAELGLRRPVIRVGNLEAKRDFSDVRDIVRGYYLALTRGEPGEVYNLGAEQAFSIRELLDRLLGMSAIPLEVEQDPARLRPSDVPIVVSDCAKIREQTGWRPQIPIEQSLRDVLEYWRKRVANTYTKEVD